MPMYITATNLDTLLDSKGSGSSMRTDSKAVLKPDSKAVKPDSKVSFKADPAASFKPAKRIAPRRKKVDYSDYNENSAGYND